MSIVSDQSDDTRIGFKIQSAEPITHEGKPLTLDLRERIEAEIAKIDEVDDVLVETNHTLLITLIGDCYNVDALLEIELQALAILASIVDSSIDLTQL